MLKKPVVVDLCDENMNGSSTSGVSTSRNQRVAPPDSKGTDRFARLDFNQMRPDASRSSSANVLPNRAKLNYFEGELNLDDGSPAVPARAGFMTGGFSSSNLFGS